jgi:membrane fusion protein (multidrug efflux system)
VPLTIVRRCFALDARTRDREPSAEQPRLPERRTGQPASEQARKTGDREADDKPSPSLRDRLRGHWMLAIVAACVLLAVVIGGVTYWLDARHYESTDDAFIAARSFSVAPKVGGYVTDIPVTDNQHVNAGDLLARIDQRDYKIAVDQAKAQVAVAQANIGNVQAQLDSQRE